MNRHKLICIGVFLFMILQPLTPVYGAEFAPAANAKSAVLIDAVSGTVLYEQNSHEKLPPASVTKVMTMLLVTEAIDSGRVSLDDEITISEHAASMGGSQMYMEPGEVHTLDEILTGISMVSANDACVAAAEFISGSSDIFVEEMNKRAKALGLKDTHFENTNGLPVSNHYTSAYDIAVMSAELLKHDVILPYLSNTSCSLNVGKSADKQTTLEMVNTNKLLRSYSGAIGIKTGFTQDAKYCLSAAATRNDMTLIAVILGSESSQIRFSEAQRLLDYGYANYEVVKIADKNEIIGNASVEKGKIPFTDLKADQKIQVLVPKGEASDISYKTSPKDGLTAPLKEGDTAGKIIVTKKDEVIAEYDLSAAIDVKKAGYKKLILQGIEKLVMG
ncbi:MAG: D-alanyl-D-alanine carboxypeptidase [Firmicutes bacterium]|nr:D-alanyl-D-alanine carboxypeptidase [Bacillota bacterium]